ncbi:hypothetical protein ADE_41510 [Achromobacter denitrificans]|uniref:hypothetical protein n=1 Tax=Achromobacter denitrificans TaxID=32002 RepID=UPI0019890902|nr:hypothetical protein [Achromobacter denitrificans]GFN28453.1 hypothetical protein ADE_41510 [Achromobacter denitrificans]
MKKTLMTAALAALLSAGAQAASWPNDKPIRIVHGFSSAAATQMLAQEIAERLHAETGATVYVEPRPGAGGISAPTSWPRPRRTATRCTSRRRRRRRSTR